MFNFKKTLSILLTPIIFQILSLSLITPQAANASTHKQCSAIYTSESDNSWQRGRILICGSYGNDEITVKASTEDMMYYSLGAWYQQSTRNPVKLRSTFSFFLNDKLWGSQVFPQEGLGSHSKVEFTIPINTAGTYTIKLDAKASGGYWGESGMMNNLDFEQVEFTLTIDPKHTH